MITSLISSKVILKRKGGHSAKMMKLGISHLTAPLGATRQQSLASTSPVPLPLKQLPLWFSQLVSLFTFSKTYRSRRNTDRLELRLEFTGSVILSAVLCKDLETERIPHLNP